MTGVGATRVSSLQRCRVSAPTALKRVSGGSLTLVSTRGTRHAAFPGGPRASDQPDDEGLAELLWLVVPGKVHAGPSTSQRGARRVGAPQVQVVSAAGASVNALAGGYRTSRAVPLCALACWREAVGFDWKSRMRREFHVRFREGLGVKFPRATRLIVGFQYHADTVQFQVELRERLRRFGLELHPDKTRLISFGQFAAPRRAERGLKTLRGRRLGPAAFLASRPGLSFATSDEPEQPRQGCNQKVCVNQRIDHRTSSFGTSRHPTTSSCSRAGPGTAIRRSLPKHRHANLESFHPSMYLRS